MDDKQIQELARMVVEIEALERSASGLEAPIARIGPSGVVQGPVGRLLIGVGTGLAAAACLVLGLLLMQPHRPVPAGPGPGLALGPSVPVETESPAPRIVATAAQEKCVVMSLFRDTNGHCSCLQVSEPEWEDGRQLADVSRGEVRRIALRAPCDNEAQQVFIVAVSGREDTLPRTHAQAEAIAQQLSTAAASVGRHADVSSFARAAMPGLSDGATVFAETVSMRQPSRVKDLLQGATAGWR